MWCSTAFPEKGEPFRERSPQHSVSTKGLGPCASQPEGPFYSKTALEALKAWCEVRTGKTPGPSDVAEEWMRPCRARWGCDLSMGRTLEQPGPKR
jgi:hypothetical protein